MKLPYAVAVGATFAFGASGCGSTTTPTPPISITTATPVSAATVAHWVSAWCTVSTAMTRSQIETAMGTPTSTPTQQESWDSGDWSFTAFYHSDGTLMQLDFNPSLLSSGEQAQLSCSSTRKATTSGTKGTPAGTQAKPTNTAAHNSAPASFASIRVLWCKLAIGQPKAQVLAAMPSPSGSKAGAFTAGQDAVEWDSGNDIFLATFTNGTASNLQAYAGSVGPAGATDISCAPFRS